MSLGTRCVLALLATIVACGSLSRHIGAPEVPQPLGPARHPGRAPWSRAEASNTLDPEHRLNALPAEAPRPFLRPIQSRNTASLAAGKLLVASRDLADPNFAQTVVLLIRYDVQGVVGLVLNRRTDLPLSRVLEGIKVAKDRSDPDISGVRLKLPPSLACFSLPPRSKALSRFSVGFT